MSTLSGKTALVTGASRGMGRAAALALAAAGARVVMHYGRGADEAKAVVDQIRAAGGRADAVAADLTAADGAHLPPRRLREFGSGFAPKLRLSWPMHSGLTWLIAEQADMLEGGL
jgi:3-oxoacyl-[acyl-carrier protein] reductase